MEKQKAIEMLGGTPGKAAKALGYTAVQTVYQWKDPLPQFLEDRVNGAAMRLAKQRKPNKRTNSLEPSEKAGG